MAATEKQSIFSTLNAIDVNGHTEKKKTGSAELTYLSWPWAWAEIKKRYPEASYTIYRDEHNKPYIEDPDMGLMCYTTVTIEGQTHEMWLPVMDGANKAMKRTSYTYQVWDKINRKFVDKTVAAATMFDINKTIMRCLVKNIAMFGLGLYIYAGEDLPETPTDQQPAQQQPAQQQDDPLQEAFELIKPNILSAPSRDYLKNLISQNEALNDYPPFKAAINARWKQVN